MSTSARTSSPPGAHEGAVELVKHHTARIRHGARNALPPPVATAVTLGFGASIGGNVAVETVFGWPGLGKLLVDSVAAREYPAAQDAFS